MNASSVQRGKKYFWVSRDNAELMRIDAPQFTYFVHTGGGGYVKVLTGSRKETNAPADYIENITQRIRRDYLLGQRRIEGRWQSR